MDINAITNDIIGILASINSASKTSGRNPIVKKSKAKNNKAKKLATTIVKPSVPAVKKLPTKYCSCRVSDCLNEIKYYPNGNAPLENNALRSFDDSNCYWYCSDKKVAFVDPIGNKVIVVAPNAYERFISYVAKKWGLERDWIPTYRYTYDDNKAEVGSALFEALRDGVDKSKITKMCFDRLDYIHRAKPDKHKTLPKEENCNDAERFLYASLFTGDVNTLNALLDIAGNAIPLPTIESLEDFSEWEMNQFKKVALLFERTKAKHEYASPETWLSAQCYALNMPTKDAIKFIYGDKSVGKKKFRRCEVAYSRQANQVLNWLLDELRCMFDEGVGEGLDKWFTVLRRAEAMTWSNRALDIIDKYELMMNTWNEYQRQAMDTLIIINPMKAKEQLKLLLDKFSEENNCDFLAEMNGEEVPVSEENIDEQDEELEEVVVTVATDEEIMPF